MSVVWNFSDEAVEISEKWFEISSIYSEISENRWNLAEISEFAEIPEICETWFTNVRGPMGIGSPKFQVWNFTFWNFLPLQLVFISTVFAKHICFDWDWHEIKELPFNVANCNNPGARCHHRLKE